MHKLEVAFNRGYRVDREGLAHGIRVEVLSSYLGTKGYQYFVIRIGGKRKNVYIHQLQAYQKFGQDMLYGGIEVRHLNGDKLDNSWDNTAIGTRTDNARDIPADIRHTIALVAGRAKSKLSIETVQEIRRLREEEGWLYTQLMAEFGVAKSTVGRIIRRERWCDI